MQDTERRSAHDEPVCSVHCHEAFNRDIVPMEAEIRLFAMFRRYLPDGSGEFSFRSRFEGQKTVGVIMEELRLPRDVPKIVIVGALQVDADYVIKDGDIVSIFPPMGGG